MNWDRVEGQWKQRRGKAVHRWGKMMNDDLAAIAGKHQLLVGILQEKYGIAEEEARRQVDGFKKIIKQLRKSNAALMEKQMASGRTGVKSKSPLKKRSRS